MITTSSGTTISIVSSDGMQLVIADNPAAPEDMRNRELGRVIYGGFQPAPFAAWGMTTETLRAIADLIDQR